MSAEPRTLRTKTEEAIAALFAQSRGALPGGEPVRARRSAAFSFFEQFGLPHRRVEAWKYTDLRTLMRTAPPLGGPAPSALLATVAEADPITTLDRAQIVIVNGVFEAELSDLSGIEGVTVEPLAHVLATSPERVGRLVDDASDTVVALNAALMQGGAVVTVAPGARPARAIEIVHLTAGVDPLSVYARSVVDVGAGAHVRFVESHRGAPGLAYQVNALIELDVGEAARVTWGRVQTESDAALHVTSFFARLGARAELDHVAVNSGAALARWQAFLNLAGKGVRIGFSGATMLSGTEHGDTTLVVTHGEPHQSSRELYKVAIDGRGPIGVPGQDRGAPHAQKTDAKMRRMRCCFPKRPRPTPSPNSKSSPTTWSAATARPSGRSTIRPLFYLKARGIPQKEAEQLMVEAFIGDAVDVGRKRGRAGGADGHRAAWLEGKGLTHARPAVSRPYDVARDPRGFSRAGDAGLRQAAGLSR
jgi:Fe-S cluster assembly protein SufD